MKLPRTAVLSIVAAGNASGSEWVIVPQDLTGKANALCRSGFLMEGDTPGTYRVTPLGRIAARDLENME